VFPCHGRQGKLSELNNMVTVRVAHGPLEEKLVGDHNVVVFTSGTLAELVRWNEFAHANHIAFIAAGVLVSPSAEHYRHDEKIIIIIGTTPIALPSPRNPGR
jgi:hypothetical protein